jgi:PKD repeat protein
VVTFSSAGTTTFGGSSITSYSWSFGDGHAASVSNPSNTYAVAGTYTVTLTVTDSLGRTGTMTVTITVS